MNPFPKNTQYVFSGKSAIALILRYLRREGVLADKSEQVLVPEWLGTWVYMTMQNYCFPTTVMNKKVRAMMVYHQWGFPQKMEKITAFAHKHKLFVIEDCAHTIDSTYKGRQTGTFGDVSVWSFSKFFSVLVGGGLSTKNKKLRQFVTNEYHHHDKKLERKAMKGLREGGIEIARAYAIYNQLTECPAGVKSRALQEYKEGSAEKRRRNFALLREALWGKEEEKLLEYSEVVPWMVPLFAGAKNKKIADALCRVGFESGVYRFDINRTVLGPRFVECVALPCHQKLTERDIERVIQTVRDVR